MFNGKSSGRISETSLLLPLISRLCTLALECLLLNILSMFLGNFMSDGMKYKSPCMSKKEGGEGGPE